MNVESGAGLLSKFRDDDFAASGANIVNKNDAFKQVSPLAYRLSLISGFLGLDKISSLVTRLSGSGQVNFHLNTYCMSKKSFN